MIALLRSLATYRDAVLPAVGRELAGWEERARKIPDDALRRAAAEALEKRANVEATAVFATLAPRARRRAVVRASVALQVAIDYLDVLDEEAGRGDLASGLELHASLATAFGGAAPRRGLAGAEREHGPLGPTGGGYLAALLSACREAAASLPAAGAVLPLARREAIRCGEGQAHTHAAATEPGALERWTGTLPAPTELHWWEAAAGGSSSVAAHALLALAARPGATAAEAEMVAAAYDPWVGALTVILDDLVDREADLRAGEHNYLSYYGDDSESAARIDFLVTGARERLQTLPRPGGHQAILTGVLAFYLGAADSEDPVASGARSRHQPSVRALAALLRLT